MILCLKVGDNGDFVFLSGSAIDGVLNTAQNGSIFLKMKSSEPETLHVNKSLKILCVVYKLFGETNQLTAGSGKVLRQ